MKKENRIKKNHEIASIVNLRKKVVNKSFVIYYKENKNEKSRFAFSVSKKYGHAFERNKAKRISRNLFRKYINKYSNIDFVVVLKPNLKEMLYSDLEKEVDFLFTLINKNLKKEKKSVK